ncbi:hypothetical protein C3Y87_17290 [Carbonactinospora thermoautotrophica]|uniref:hypothetical protein n=1 Tax=Carbonactinospora thermoautotrophica TaxID=1469144 RepID=UPI00226DF0C2|nr:hypothetical protein [Carbonactinospora thermoautotrophica]MCX9193136.1 hypothetical protein [Carbonactinospora thermoautotrophica]
MTDEAFLVLNAVYLRKIATTEAIEGCTGLPLETVTAAVRASLESGLLEDMGGQYMLTGEGTRAVLDGYTERYASLRSAEEVEAWYQRFETLNTQFLQTLSAWQTAEEADSTLLDRLVRLVERHIRALESFTNVIPRYRGYADRFRRALDLVDAGREEFVTSPTVDSLHNIWFEFHEDILTVLGRPRDVAEQQA